MADFFADPGAWFDQAGKDIAKFFNGDNADGSDTADGSDINRVNGGEENDELYAGTGRDALKGWGGNDILWGQQGDDWLWGGWGDDILIGGSGADKFGLSAGQDIFADFNLSENDIIEMDYWWEGQINICEYDFNDIGVSTLLTSSNGDTVIVRGAQGIDVYNSIVMDYEGQCQLVAENFEVPA